MEDIARYTEELRTSEKDWEEERNTHRVWYFFQDVPNFSTLLILTIGFLVSFVLLLKVYYRVYQVERISFLSPSAAAEYILKHGRYRGDPDMAKSSALELTALVQTQLRDQNTRNHFFLDAARKALIWEVPSIVLYPLSLGYALRWRAYRRALHQYQQRRSSILNGENGRTALG